MTEHETQVVIPTDSIIKREIAAVLNRHSIDNRSNTPDFILADVMWDALVAFEDRTAQRERWYGGALVPAMLNGGPWVPDDGQQPSGPTLPDPVTGEPHEVSRDDLEA